MKRKNIRVLLLYVMLIMIVCVCSTINVVAEQNIYVNNKGVSLTDEALEKLLSMFHISQIDNFSQEQVNKYLSGQVVSSETKYFRTVYQGESVLSNTEISKEEFDNAPDTTTICNESTRGSDAGFFETSYKALSTSLIDIDSGYSFSILLHWKIVPATRSYDVIAFRTKHLSYSNVSGVQTYYVGNTPTNITYTTSSAGYKGLSNGAGISMNLKDDTNITSFIMTLLADMQISEYNYSTAHVFSTYQHAQSSLTRAQSMSYTLQVGGLGDVLYYSNSTIRNKYDDMTGIELRIPIP